MSSLYLIDISSYIFRAYYAIRALKNSKGIPTNATYGVITMLLKLIREKKPDRMVVVFDSPTPTFRKEMYPEYKAHRPDLPEDLPGQFEWIKKFIDVYPLPKIEAPGFEADDIMATLAQKYQKMGYTVFIVSGDKDLMQVIGPGITMFDPMKDKLIAEKEVLEKFGVSPDKVVDVLALSGDASDNVPGVPGIGDKTAIKLIQEWGSVENLLQHAGEIKGKLGENLKNYQHEAILSKKLVMLHRAVPLHLDDNNLVVGPPHQKKLNEFYSELELHSLVIEDEKAIQEKVAEHSSVSAASYDLVLTVEQLAAWAKKIGQATHGFAFDTETTGLDLNRDELVGLSLSVEEGKGCYIPIKHFYLGCPEQLSKKEIFSALQAALQNPHLPKYGQNAKFDMRVLIREGIEIKGLAGDSMIASYLLEPEARHNMDHLAKEYLHYDTLTYASVVGKKKSFESVELSTACRYAAEDADITLRLVNKLHPMLKKEGLWDLYEKIELPLVDVLFRMENHGVLVDEKILTDLSREFGERLRKLEQEIYASAGTEFNVQSPRQVGEILFGKLNLPVQRKTKTGFSTDAEVLADMVPLHPLPGLLLQHRMLSKLKSTYIEGLRQLINPITGRIHTHYNQTMASTGRLSSSDPNLQNIPIRTEEGKRIRQTFRAPSGYKILSADYSQIELRLLAAFSKDKNLIAAFDRGEDIHRMTAEKIFNKSEQEVTSELRSMAKTVNFGVIYGQSAFGLSKQLEISVGEAKQFIEAFYQQFPAVEKYREQVLSEVRKKGFVETWKGRRRAIPDIQSKNQNIKANAERTAFNTVFQGSAADLIKVAMIAIDKKLAGSSSKMLMQVHDELIFEVPEADVKKLSTLVSSEMEKAIPCAVSLKVDMGVGDNWAEAH